MRALGVVFLTASVTGAWGLIAFAVSRHRRPQAVTDAELMVRAHKLYLKAARASARGRDGEAHVHQEAAERLLDHMKEQ